MLHEYFVLTYLKLNNRTVFNVVDKTFPVLEKYLERKVIFPVIFNEKTFIYAGKILEILRELENFDGQTIDVKIFKNEISQNLVKLSKTIKKYYYLDDDLIFNNRKYSNTEKDDILHYLSRTNIIIDITKENFTNFKKYLDEDLIFNFDVFIDRCFYNKN